jgi:hypothetical protein
VGIEALSMSETVVELSGGTKVKRADIAWFVLALYVAAYDYYAIKTGRETMSRAYWRALEKPRTRWPAIIVTTSVVKHLALPKFLPQLDPLNRVAEGWHKKSPHG